MNHNELLNDIGLCLESNYTKILTDALRAVVELHRPTNDGMCGKCLGLAADWITYPCSTIQAIEKELS